MFFTHFFLLQFVYGKTVEMERTIKWVNKLLCWVQMFVNLTDDVSASPAMNLAACLCPPGTLRAAIYRVVTLTG